MIDEVVVKQWALALFQVAIEEKKILSYRKQILVLLSLLQIDRKFLSIIASKHLPLAVKEKIVKTTFVDFSTYIVNFLLLLTKKNYFYYILTILQVCKSLCDTYCKIEIGVVCSVVPLNITQIQQLEKIIKNKLKKTVSKIKLVNKIDSSLIGGIKIKVKNEIFDGSIKGQIERLQTQLHK